ncbi:hypothetical protein ADIARSV_1377 [Arcticibacter svalbardensis MN12-7]|uniref:Uncharacterized protein n=1 Tax=Arcticibacter svalbardensis MN12-7 TaxID=1150600 RepID=R9GUQ3_9SPHI|nr:hypothetical protein [Arcticibacter svalbardensis]EOR95461.1 hypothetical protein ADIARSV_1377 [Arcticibacter svalbardensis MN12-7]
MAEYSIPKSFEKGFRHLINLEHKDLIRISEKMNQFEVGGGPLEFQKFLRELEIDEIDEISKSIFSFGKLLLDNYGNYRPVVEGLLKAYIREYDNSFLNKDNEDIIQKLMIIFESSSKVKMSYKTMSLMSDVPNVFRESSILTDIRVVFNDDILDANRNAIISQQIKLIYIENTIEKALYLNADRFDLEELKGQIDRALLKEEVFRNEYSDKFKFVKSAN